MSRPDRYEALLLAVRKLYGAVDAFDAGLAAKLGVDRTALRAINAMETGAIAPGELGRRLRLASGSVTALLDRLERAGHIERRLSDIDRRRRDADLTEPTREQASEHYEALATALRSLFEDLDHREVERITRALEAVAQAFAVSAPSLAGG